MENSTWIQSSSFHVVPGSVYMNMPLCYTVFRSGTQGHIALACVSHSWGLTPCLSYSIMLKAVAMCAGGI